MTEKECAAEFGCSPSLIHKKIAMYGIKGHPCTQRAHEKVKQLIDKGDFILQRIDNLGDKNPSKRPDVREKIRLSKLGPKNGMYGVHGKDHPQYGKIHHSHGSWYTNPWNGKYVWLRSSWEKRVADYLFENGIKWEYEYKTFKMGEMTYTPDFYLPHENKYVEVKGWMSPVAKEKIETFMRWHPDIKIEVWDSEKVVRLGILTQRETKIKLEY